MRGDLASGDEFWVMILIEDTEDRLKFTLQLLVNKCGVRFLTVGAPQPTSTPVLTEQSVSIDH